MKIQTASLDFLNPPHYARSDAALDRPQKCTRQPALRLLSQLVQFDEQQSRSVASSTIGVAIASTFSVRIRQLSHSPHAQPLYSHHLRTRPLDIADLCRIDFLSPRCRPTCTSPDRSLGHPCVALARLVLGTPLVLPAGAEQVIPTNHHPPSPSFACTCPADHYYSPPWFAFPFS